MNRNIWFCLVLIFCIAARGGETVKPERTAKMDYGPFLATSLLKTKLKAPENAGKNVPPHVLVMRGVVVRVGGEKTPAAVCYDTETLAIAAAWTGDFLDV